MVIKKVIKGSWTEENKLKIVEYWESRGIVFTIIDDDILEGSRGKVLGHMFSFKPSDLKTEICIVEYSETEIVCEVTVKDCLQNMSEYCKQYFELEIDSCENMINNGKELVNEWKVLNKKAHRSMNKVKVASLFLGACVGLGLALSYNGLKDIV